MLAGFGFTGYRSFHGDLQLFGSMRKVNLLAGQNNSGKSNALRFLAKFINSSERSIPADLDVPNHASHGGQFELAVAIEQDIVYAYFEEQLKSRSRATADISNVIELFNHPAVRLIDESHIWFRYGAGLEISPEPPVSMTNDSVRRQIAMKLSTDLTQSSGGQPGDDMARLIRMFNPIERVPPVHTIEAFRQVRETGDSALGFSGENLIQELARLQNPAVGPQFYSDEQKFKTINRFLQVVLDDSTASLRIPFKADAIYVTRNSVTLPLDYYGTGVHQVVIIAAAATLKSDSLVCIEEPEVHLHPLLQRKLLRYLASETDNQYIIATHSAHILDHETASIYRISSTPDGSKVTSARTPAEVSEICADLGYRPSDLLQANSVIWVEGPSDRIYIQHWLATTDHTLIEGIHYSIMFYGGRLLSHLSANETDIGRFISLRRLNRNIIMIIDSDKKNANEQINASKTRVCEEFESAEPSSSWVTNGYTIENYIPLEILQEAAQEVHGRTTNWNGDRWTNPLYTEKDKPKFDKVRIAHAVCSRWSPSDYSKELQDSINDVVRIIQKANSE